MEGERIYAADLARALPAFAAVDPGVHFAYSPNPGTERVFTGSQLRRLARRHGLPEESMRRVCFVREAAPLTEEQVRASLRTALGSEDVSITIVDYCRKPVPAGELVFSLSELPRPRPGAEDEGVLWRGKARYGERRSMPVWARVRLKVSRQQVVALRDLRAGEKITDADVGQITTDAFPEETLPIRSPREVIGAISRRSIRAGEAIREKDLRLPNDVERGDIVDVFVVKGLARLEFEAKAESSGRVGDMVYVRNPVNGRRFVAVVTEKGKVVVKIKRARESTS